MQVSLKIGSDGQFGLEMGQARDADYLHAQLDGLKLHLHSVLDSSGVTLTLSVSVEAENGNGRRMLFALNPFRAFSMTGFLRCGSGIVLGTFPHTTGIRV
jgi:hypothetical protein